MGGGGGSSLKKFALVWFKNKGQGQPTTFFFKISVRRSKDCLEFSFT